ncbi:biotin synthase BioB [Haliangium sp.]|uniref:biotin synthase BioB n=1 Tax=Haliangium sp. TaxID=2663208 RepID=UPI003D0FC5A2
MHAPVTDAGPPAAPWQQFADRALAGEALDRADCRRVLEAPTDQLLPLLDAAFRVRRAHFGRRVHIHVLENAKLGSCPEDCGFCSQSGPHGSPAGEAPIETIDTLVAGAHRAAERQAKRYCMVTATRGPSSRDLDVVCEATRRIKAELDIEVCASLGLLTAEKAKRLAEAGVDRFNHNLETSERYFGQMVSTHTWADRVATVETAKAAGMTVCCGGIVGLGESDEDLIDLALALRALEVDSVPVNFLDPRPGTPLAERERITPTYALKALCMFRFLHPKADLRVAGGREVTLRSMQAMALYPANSIFTSGYLTTGGATPDHDHQMIRDLGFELELAGGRVADARTVIETGGDPDPSSVERSPAATAAVRLPLAP